MGVAARGHPLALAPLGKAPGCHVHESGLLTIVSYDRGCSGFVACIACFARNPPPNVRLNRAKAVSACEAPQAQTIIVGELFTGLDAAQGIEPNALTHDHRLTVRYAAVIEEAGRMIPRHAAVDIIGLVERKEAGIAVLEFGQAFGFPIVIRKFWRLRKNGGHHPMPFPKSLSFIIAHNELMRF